MDPSERARGPAARDLLRSRWRFMLLLCFFFLVHALTILWLATRDDSDELAQPATKEIPIEVEVIPPPPPPPPKPPPPKTEKQPQKPPPPPKVDEKPAFDAPKTATDKTKQNQATDKQTQAQTKAAPSEASPTDTKPVPLEPTRDTPLAKDTPSAPDQPEDKPDAEPLAKAEPLPKNSPKPAPAPPKHDRRRVETSRAGLAKTLAAMEPVPNYSVAAAAKAAIIGGGTEEATYNAVLLGLILKQQHMPRSANLHHQDAKVMIGFFIDDHGNLTHQALYRTSGEPSLDAAAIEAVRRAAPFPRPPPGIPHAFVAQLVFPAR